MKYHGPLRVRYLGMYYGPDDQNVLEDHLSRARTMLGMLYNDIELGANLGEQTRTVIVTDDIYTTEIKVIANDYSPEIWLTRTAHDQPVGGASGNIEELEEVSGKCWIGVSMTKGGIATSESAELSLDGTFDICRNTINSKYGNDAPPTGYTPIVHFFEPASAMEETEDANGNTIGGYTSPHVATTGAWYNKFNQALSESTGTLQVSRPALSFADNFNVYNVVDGTYFFQGGIPVASLFPQVNKEKIGDGGIDLCNSGPTDSYFTCDIDLCGVTYGGLQQDAGVSCPFWYSPRIKSENNSYITNSGILILGNYLAHDPWVPRGGGDTLAGASEAAVWDVTINLDSNPDATPLTFFGDTDFIRNSNLNWTAPFHHYDGSTQESVQADVSSGNENTFIQTEIFDGEYILIVGASTESGWEHTTHVPVKLKVEIRFSQQDPIETFEFTVGGSGSYDYGILDFGGEGSFEIPYYTQGWYVRGQAFAQPYPHYGHLDGAPLDTSNPQHVFQARLEQGNYADKLIVIDINNKTVRTENIDYIFNKDEYRRDLSDQGCCNGPSLDGSYPFEAGTESYGATGSTSEKYRPFFVQGWRVFHTFGLLFCDQPQDYGHPSHFIWHYYTDR